MKRMNITIQHEKRDTVRVLQACSPVPAMAPRASVRAVRRRYNEFSYRVCAAAGLVSMTRDASVVIRSTGERAALDQPGGGNASWRGAVDPYGMSDRLADRDRTKRSKVVSRVV